MEGPRPGVGAALAASEDERLAAQIAGRMRDAVGGILKAVYLLGSRANGTASDDSDMDLVVVVELAEGSGPWGPEWLRRARRVFVEGSTPHPAKLDVWVRTADQFEEGHLVVGGFEHLAYSEGVKVFSAPLSRRPVANRGVDEVRRANVRSWLGDAEVSLQTGVEHTAQVALHGDESRRSQAVHYSWRSIQRAITGLLVHYQVGSSKSEDLAALLGKVDSVDEEASAWLGIVTADDVGSVVTANAVLRGILGRLLLNEDLHPYLAGVARRVQEPLVLFRI